MDLGKLLFFDTRLSADGKISCASCHKPHLAFADSTAVSEGVFGSPGIRNSPSLFNVAWLSVLTWNNPLLKTLESQIPVPLLGDSPVEHGLAGMTEEKLGLLWEDPKVRHFHSRAFPNSGGLTLDNVTGALASYLRSLVTFSSTWDQKTFFNNPDAMSPAAIRGEDLFVNRLHCASCHVPPHFTDAVKSSYGEPISAWPFHNTGLYNIDGRGGYPESNPGVAELTENPRHQGQFRTPSLRNVALTPPYMHDGSIETLEDVLDHYARGGGHPGSGQEHSEGAENPLRDKRIQKFSLTSQEKSDLVAFLKSLTSTGLTDHDAAAQTP